MATDPWAEFNPQPLGATAAPAGPVYGAPPKPEKPPEPKTTYRTLSPAEAAAQGLPAGGVYQTSSQGDLSTVASPKAAGEGSPTEAQAKTSTLLTRIVGGFNDIQSVTSRDPSAQEPGFIETVRGDLTPGGWTGPAVRGIAGADRRTVHDSQRDVLDALLTLGTGAAYNAEQLSGAMTSHFPAYNDTPAEIEVKNNRMRRLIEAAKMNAGPQWGNIEQKIAPYMASLSPAPKAGEVDVDDGTIPEGQVITGYGKNEDGSSYPIYGTPDGSGGPPPGGGGGLNDYLKGEMGITPKLDPRFYDPSGTTGIRDLARQGITLGLSDEAGGVGDAISAMFTGDDPYAAYLSGTARERENLKQARKAHPITGAISEFLGGGAGVKVAGAANSLLSTVRQGGALGGIAGYGYGEGPQGSAVNALAGAATGGAVGGTLYGAGKGINALASRGRPAIDTSVVEAGARQGIPIRRPDAIPAMRNQASQVETTQAGGPMIRDARAADQVKVENRVAEIGGQGAVADPYALGSRVQGAGTRYIARTKAQAGRMYDQARKAANGQTVQPTEAVAALDRHIADLKASGANSNKGQIDYLEGLKGDLSKPLSIESVQSLRTNMRGQINERGLTASDAERRVGDVIDAANMDLARDLPPQASQALKAADAFYRERQTFIKGTLQQFLGTKGAPLEAEMAGKRLVSMAQGGGKFDKFSAMWKQLEPDEQADVSATIAASLGRKANGEFSLSTLVRSLDPAKGINPRTARLVFGDDGARALADLRQIANAKTDTQGGLNNSRTGVAVNAAANGFKKLLLAGFGFAGGGPAGAVATPMAGGFIQQIGEQRAAKMLLNPDFTKWLKNAPNTANPQAINRYYSRLSGVLAANDNKALSDALINIARNSPGRAAAEGEPDPRRKPVQ